ncbi:hypothetical protein [Tenacibaculum amylolyticum]|uniref:hypothetical protein n=1 Tax=Tenacibaculum amylolyticum TaxID=104269 RepID=UPI0038939003
MKNLFNLGRFMSPIIEFFEGFTRVGKTIDSFTKHLKAFNEDRERIWADAPKTIKVVGEEEKDG